MTTMTKVNVKQQAQLAQKASKELGLLPTGTKNQALLTIADHLEANTAAILAANEKDLANGREAGYDAAYMDRLALDTDRVKDFADGLRQVAKLEDPSGEVTDEWTLDNGLNVQTIRVPLGVIGMIYEARPNVTADATGLALKSGNAIVLKGGSSAINSNRQIVSVMKEALEHTEISSDAVQFIDSTDRQATEELFTMKEHIDVLIPRGGGKLISAVVNNATVPVLETGVGNCHIYIDKDADAKKAFAILVNAKTDRPAVCNAAETVIIHEAFLNAHKDELIETLKENNISVYGDEAACKALPGAEKAEEEQWANEFLSLDIAMKIVSDVDEAISHIDEYGTKHSEAIVTDNEETAKRFKGMVDAAAIYQNASTRFTDGSALGFGAEIGISTQKLHARGPMGLPALTTIKYVMTGDGQIR
ncbi:glutamate-5-semialdehyde dehydrogenase [Jeotgalibacillus haloalkalitolerans]|uniref:Gamma-glutamyl phosphate reductase n=1 Tax=Jeotgalibacillus haloalkalitolerans TaxID=3104292 RepID=A0ABU5KKS1_9BACL|nr:glutamate-5-semialdehyde dehydrogenase [Jeotgalibacillus sp. HH7-29]MDZ5711859.1 glutamate-5-semialdehyde dehydrogenase [Jeotgalibacillus sp. HH7-29]